MENNYPELSKGLPVNTTMFQKMKFLMNERGAKLESVSVVGTFKSASFTKAEKVDLVFDDKFKVLLKRYNKKKPYFALEVNNSEVLIKS